MCTEKLNLPFAARRVFLEEGVEIFEAEDIPIDGEVYISCGEKYKDPYSSLKRKSSTFPSTARCIPYIGNFSRRFNFR